MLEIGCCVCARLKFISRLHTRNFSDMLGDSCPRWMRHRLDCQKNPDPPWPQVQEQWWAHMCNLFSVQAYMDNVFQASTRLETAQEASRNSPEDAATTSFMNSVREWKLSLEQTMLETGVPGPPRHCDKWVWYADAHDPSQQHAAVDFWRRDQLICKSSKKVLLA